MALSMIKKSTLPVLRGGPGKLNVAIRVNGQISFSSEATKILRGSKFCVVGFDSDKRTLQFQGVAAVPAKMTESDLFKIGFGKDEKTSKGAFMSGAGLMKMLEYDYKASGNQIFDATTNAEKKIVSIVLPKGSLTPKPVTPRKSKKAKGATTPATTAPATANAPATTKEPEGDEELELVEG